MNAQCFLVLCCLIAMSFGFLDPVQVPDKNEANRARNFITEKIKSRYPRASFLSKTNPPTFVNDLESEFVFHENGNIIKCIYCML
ncbi:Neuropeptide-Like Protein [Caenorhabditis elegans]|uniref:Neuropeptide-Like Protein n=1 Tax=Caenorhabditis elegans TaxID=6239 RepID=D1MN71_CAEEL|nr:Neuropeptide-Like Protein [Caenorhabditis elegans]CBI63236.1 Neuropeptide-Like Protein [Caenorhabditis elegans]|eukprot:NP_001255408.1 Uncharacterized protein CELE_W09C2.10 [Caenorhabditis elegans]